MPGPLSMHMDPWMGVAGDMLMAALLDTDRGGSHLERVLRGAVRAMGLDPAIVRIGRAMDRGLECTSVDVAEEHDAPLRHLSDLTDILDRSDLPPKVSERSRSAFERLARVEAAVHGCSVDEIHFHEVGAMDTLIDVVGVFSLVEALGIERVSVGTIPVGGGQVEIAHGRMRVPAPATTALLEGYPVVGGPEQRELTTPTGALLVSELGAVPGPLPEMIIEHVGYGCGTMRFESGPNALRLFVGTSAAQSPLGPGAQDVVVELETNLDDVSGEIIGHVSRRLREAGSLDVWTVPIAMKKERPGVTLHALVAPGDETTAGDIIFAETGTLGVRRQFKQRRVAERGSMTVAVEGTEVVMKWGRLQGRMTSLTAEYDSAASAARILGLPLKEVMSRAAVEARKALEAEGLLP